MSEVGTPPPNNLDKPHILVDSINNNIYFTKMHSGYFMILQVNKSYTMC